MANVEYFNKLIGYGYDKEIEDVFVDGKWSITKEWIVDDNGKRIPHTTVFGIYEDEDGDYPVYGSLKAAKAALKEIRS